MKTHHIPALLFIAAWSLLPGTALACKCHPFPADPDEAVGQAFGDADIVFLGTVKAAEPVTPEYPGVVTFSVSRFWKGLDAQPSKLEFELQGTLCDVWFEPGDQAVIYGFGPNEEGRFETTTCALATGVPSLQEEISLLDNITSTKARDTEGDWVAYGCGGGFAALYPLNTIHRDGRRYSSTTAVLNPPDSTSTELPPDPRRAAAVFPALEKVDLAAVNEILEPAPYACYFKAATNSGHVNAVWGGGDSELPPELEEVIRLITADP